jgi:hypothetical protein|uniref:hypothetical protein n=1 Tax=Daejeonella sp. TaxID=2805397 RepID=UPI00404A9A72
MKRQKVYATILLTIIIFGCNQADKTTDTNNKNLAEVTSNADIGYNVIKTNQLITANATKSYSTKNRKTTQFALDKNSRQEKSENFVIKISDKKILICDEKNNVLKELAVTKKWTDKSGPSTVYDLTDNKGIDYSLDHYIDYQKKNFLGFRFSKSLATYTDE